MTQEEADQFGGVPGSHPNASWAGNQVVIRHPNGLATNHAHLSGWYVSKGQQVTAGQTIGPSGVSGRTTGAHLHFEVIDLSALYAPAYGRVNPFDYIDTNAPVPEENEVPQHTRFSVDPTTSPRLAANTMWVLKTSGGTQNLNFASGTGGPGLYDAVLFLQGAGLTDGATITTRWVIVRDGRRSGYFEQEVHGSADGAFRGTATFKAPIISGDLLEVEVTSSKDSVYLQRWAADVYRFA